MPSSYPLDLPGSGLLARMASQPYPAYPDGIYVSRATFEKSMSPWTPITVGILYLIMSKTANARLKKRVAAGEKPHDYVKASKFWSQAVLAHNAFLALYSGWTFVHAAIRVIPYFYTGIRQGGLQGLGQAYCTVPTSDPHGLGRFIWLFYISKFYEIVDSMILVAKGKKVSNLQSYHHAGAIAAMWAGSRFSASALWLFLLFNSGIHTLMYSYYTFSTLRLPFAGALKKSMTTAQITQLVVGCFIASMYLVVRYTPESYTGGALPSIGDLDALVSNSALYQSLRESLAAHASGDSNSFPAQLARFIVSSPAKTQPPVSRSTSSAGPSETATMLLRDGLLHAANKHQQGLVSCCASTGQAFAVALNVIYLIPLIVLFLRFYFRSYKAGSARVSAKKVE